MCYVVVVQTYHFLKTVQKSKKQKSYKNSYIFKNDGHFRITHPQMSLKQYSNICENVVYFFGLSRGVEKCQGFLQSNSIFKNKK